MQTINRNFQDESAELSVLAALLLVIVNFSGRGIRFKSLGNDLDLLFGAKKFFNGRICQEA